MSTYTPIATATLSGSESSINFTGIPQTYTDLIIVGSSKGAATTAGTWLAFNGDTATNYSRTRLLGDGSSASTISQNNVYPIQGDSPQNEWGTTVWTINNYSNSTTFKTVLWRDNTTTYVAAQTGLWRSTSAITSILLSTNSSATNFAAGTTFSIYGIANAGITNVAKATGGDIVTTDGTYWYHAFTSTGVFTPKQALTADLLVIAGGGAGANNVVPGSGAGGLVNLTSQSLSTTNYTVTVGAGAAGGSAYTNGSNSQFGGLTAAVGGGAPGNWQSGNGASGGSGGGGAGFTGVGGSGTAGQGNAGGNGASAGGSYGTSGGGGGAGAVGSNAVTTTPGAGGAGSSSFSSWGLATGTGHNVSGTVWFAGGGTGGGYVGSGYAHYAGSNGGGGRGSTFDVALAGASQAAGGNGLANTGGGAGGGGSSGGASGNGGSGIVIVRYAV